jgi:hypothetical protein
MARDQVARSGGLTVVSGSAEPAPGEGSPPAGVVAVVPTRSTTVAVPTGVITAFDVGLAVASRGVAVVVGVGRLAGLMARPVVRVVASPPGLPHRYHPATHIDALAAEGRVTREQITRASTDVIAAVLPTVVDQVLDQVDLTTMVVEHVDVAKIVESIDIGAIVKNIDIESIVGEMDLGGIANQVIEEVDLPGLIRESSGAMASDSIIAIRTQSIGADELVNRVMDRILMRRGDRTAHTRAPEPPPAQHD